MVRCGLQEKKDTAQLQSESKEKKLQIEQAEVATREASELRDAAVGIIGNYVHDSVPISKDEVGGCPAQYDDAKHHSA